MAQASAQASGTGRTQEGVMVAEPVWNENERQERMESRKQRAIERTMLRDQVNARVAEEVSRQRQAQAQERAALEQQRQILRGSYEDQYTRALEDANLIREIGLEDITFDGATLLMADGDDRSKPVLRIERRNDGQYTIYTEDGRTVVGPRESALRILGEDPYNFGKGAAERIVDRLLREAEAEAERTGQQVAPMPALDILARAGIDPVRLRAQFQQHGSKVGNAAVTKGTRAINYDEVGDICRAAMVLLEMVEVGRVPISMEAVERAEESARVAELQRTIKQQGRQIKAQATLIDEQEATIRELKESPVLPTMGEQEIKAMVAARREQTMVRLNGKLMEQGPVVAPNNLDEDLRAWLRELAIANSRPQPGEKVNQREIMQLVLSVVPLLDEIERLDELLVYALQIFPCHNPDHREEHGRGEVCEDQLGMMGLRLIRQINLAPVYLPRALHNRKECRICARPDGPLERWLATGATRDVGDAGPEDEVSVDIITEDDLENLPF